MARSRSRLDRVFDAVVPRAVGAIDPDQVLERIDVDQLVDRLDLDALLERIDVDALVRRVDVDALMARVDVDGLLGRVDLDALLARVDLNALLADVDVRAVVDRAGIDRIVADATTGLAARTLAVARRKIHALDAVLLRVVDRTLRRSPRPPDGAAPPAGPVARVLAFLLDTVVVSTTFTLGVTLGSTLLELFTARTFDVADGEGWAWIAALAVWWFAYLWLTIALSGRTVGKGFLGLLVARADGSAVDARGAAARAAAFPFSFILGLGFVPAIVGRRRRAFHDMVAGTVEVVDQR